MQRIFLATIKKEDGIMKYCSNCGKELADSSAFCSECGAPQQGTPSESQQYQESVYRQSPPQQNQQTYQAPQQAPIVDSGSFGWALLGFFFPVVGLILFLVWKDQKPLTAKKAGLGALVSVIASVVFTVIYFIIIFGLLMVY